MNLKALVQWVLFVGATLASLMCALVFCGCAEVRELPLVQESPLGPRYHATNVFGIDNSAAHNLRRVAVLPLAPTDLSSDQQAGVDTLEPVLITELQKRNRFEIVAVSRAELSRWIGRPNIRGDEILPEHFIERIQKETGCDGVFFASLTVFRAYTPTAIGWRMKLVAASGKATVWAADEVFDATSPGVVNSARDYQRGQPELVAGLREGRKILLSPSAFGHYSAGALLDTMPPRPR